MCGRYTLVVDGAELWEELGLDGPPERVEARYNIAPTQLAPVVGWRQGAPRPRLVRMRWGLVPSWAEDAGVGSRMINARSETAAKKPAFRRALARRRCLVPATGFFEWKPEGGRKTPYLITPKGGGLVTLAGLWERWLTPAKERLFSYTILTRAACPELESLHSRMPVIISSEARDAWLDVANSGAEQLARLLSESAPSRGETIAPGLEGARNVFCLRRLTARVSSVKNDDVACLAPAEDAR
ncbi:MAG: SOS response-associated peptidase [Deltaproteobacteria bacterium]|nr:SOS response-associated peptidase [Deltaproteobacteria bacterium]